MKVPTCHLSIAVLWCATGAVFAQSPQGEVLRQVDQLADQVAREQVLLESSQRQIELMRSQIAELKEQLVEASHAEAREPEQAVARLNKELADVREQQDLQQSEIATHEQAKVESESRFPVKLTGLILMNTFANTGAVDVIQSPALASGGGGSFGFSLRQSVLGLDARGPHVFGAESAADVRVDFFGNTGNGAYTQGGGVARLRTTHAELRWDTTRAFVEVDRPLISPNVPASLTAVAQPALAWSGNLWNWLPQAGVERTFSVNALSRLSMEAAIADPPDPVTPQNSVGGLAVASFAELSRRPAGEARLGYSRGTDANGLRVGIGGYVSPHRVDQDYSFDAWAATLDYRIPLFAHLEASGSVYRGLALGGLGGGTFKDYVASPNAEYPLQPLDDVGGWTQLKARAGERLEFNAAYGMDSVFAQQLRPFVAATDGAYERLNRNATLVGNVIYSPTASTLFSLEYRRIDSSFVVGPHAVADVFGVAAGYRF